MKSEVNSAVEIEKVDHKRKGRSRSIIIVAAIVIIVAIVAIVAFMGGEKEPTEKELLNTAASNISSESYEEALDNLDKIDSTHADALRYYIKVCKARDAFYEASSNHMIYVGVTSFFGGNSDVATTLENFKTEIYSFKDKTDEELLPDDLKEEYKLYLAAFESFENEIDYEEDFRKMQLASVNDVIINQGDSFTLNQLQENADTAYYTMDRLQRNLCAITDLTKDSENEFIDIKKFPFEHFWQAFDIVVDACISDTEDTEKYIKTATEDKGYGMNDELYVTDPDYEYVKNIGEHFDQVLTLDSMYSAETNASKMMKTLEASLMYYYIRTYQEWF